MISTGSQIFLFHFTPPVELGVEPTLLISDEAGAVRRWTFNELSAHKGAIITHSFSLLVDWLRDRQLPLPGLVIDLEVATRLLTGRPKSDYRVVMPWDMASVLKPILPGDRDERMLRAGLSTHMAKPGYSDLGNLRWMTSVAKGLPALWKNIMTSLQDRGEYDRFMELEVPTYNAMLEAQRRGIEINESRRDELLDQVERDYRQAHFRLAIQKGIDVERALSNVEYLMKLLGVDPAGFEVLPSSEKLIASLSEEDETCGLLDTVLRTRRNKGILLRCFGNDGSVAQVVFDTFGTVTGRIMAVDPQLQHLSKRYRSVVRAKEGHRLVYVDYSQFEPCIMAALSGDRQLLSLVREGDLYDKLSSIILGTREHRKAFKLMFLAYSYGKSVDTLSDLVKHLFPSKGEADEAIITKFAPLVQGIEAWKASIHKALESEGRIGTIKGNYRYRTQKGSLGAKERRWAISQVVQGTGSAILKRLINRVVVEMPEIRILLPMHDALLVEINESDADASIGRLIGLCKEVFLEYCPGVEPSVTQDAFAAS